ncbi:hypothetical protein ACIBCT_39055 [Streptosporangium sp. NPDC050855]|uniref:hypothetical protein n=1 Tax=Streptosporangium sp. NPDC050855 TaxID=3366194 RepID=UPI00378C4546
MTRTPPPLPPLDVDIPDWPAARRARRRLDTVRSATGRAATVAGIAAAAAGLFTGDFTGTALLATAAASGAGLVSLRAWKPGGHQRATASVLYLAPGTSLAALLVAEQMVTGTHWSEALALTVWSAGTWALRPARVARRMLCAPIPAEVVPVSVAEVVDHHPAAHWWTAMAAVDGGVAPSTALEAVERTGERSMRAVIRSTVPGEPVPDISIRRLSALMDVPEEEIAIGPVPGRGASVRRLTIGKPEDADLSTIWAQKIAPLAMPGAVLTDIRVGYPGAAEAAATVTVKEPGL